MAGEAAEFLSNGSPQEPPASGKTRKMVEAVEDEIELPPLLTTQRTREVIILMYHDIREEPAASAAVEAGFAVVSTDTFRAHLEALVGAGFQTASFADLIAFVDHGHALPERFVVITFDDGYRSNLDLAAPILAEFGMCATVSVIGIARGRDTYRDTDIPIIPHFTWDEARPWVEQGVIHIGHHTHDMHMARHLEPPETFRHGVLQREGESETDFRAAFIADFETLRNEIMRALGREVPVFTYPFGQHSALTEALLYELGVRVTLITTPGVSTIEQGVPASLFSLYRMNMHAEITGADLVLRLAEWHTPGQ